MQILLRRLTLWVCVFCIQSLQAQELVVQSFIELPEAISNNAVTATGREGLKLYSFNGLTAGRRYSDIVNYSWRIDIRAKQVDALPTVPYSTGVLASIAAAVGDDIFLFGGYSVASDHSEVSHPEVFRLNTLTSRWFDAGKMPVAVDDTVALVYRQRYIYLVSGWHNIGNVSLVQVLDTHTGKWQFATPFPGTPTFGHGGAIIEGHLFITGGVKVSGVKAGKRQFDLAEQAYLGVIDEQDYTQIRWQKIAVPAHYYRYRPGVAYWSEQRCWLVLGGSRVAYNYNGIGYNGEPVTPERRVGCVDNKGNTIELGTLDKPVMDLRGLVIQANHAYWVGGMGVSQKLYQKVFRLDLGGVTLVNKQNN